MAVLRREDLNTPGPIEAHLAHGTDEADDILRALADETRRSRVSSNRVPINSVWASQSSTPKTMLGSRQATRSTSVVSARKTCQIHDQPGGRVAGRPDQVCALGHGADEGERQRLERDASSDAQCLVGEAAERFDEGRDVVHRGSELGPYLDERRPELAGRFEQQFPCPAPGQVVFSPPPEAELDLDVPEAGRLDLGPERGKADGLADDP